jgi:hypothetical protein
VIDYIHEKILSQKMGFVNFMLLVCVFAIVGCRAYVIRDLPFPDLRKPVAYIRIPKDSVIKDIRFDDRPIHSFSKVKVILDNGDHTKTEPIIFAEIPARMYEMCARTKLSRTPLCMFDSLAKRRFYEFRAEMIDYNRVRFSLIDISYKIQLR